MVLNRVGSVILVLVSLLSFSAVCLLSGREAPEGSFMERLSAQLLPAPSDEQGFDEFAAPPAKVVADAGAALKRARAAIFRSEEEKDGVIRRTLVLGRGDTLTSRLVAAGITRSEVLVAMDALRQQVSPRRIHGGQEVVVLFTHAAEGERFAGLELRPEATQLVTVNRLDGDRFTAVSRTVEAAHQRIALRGKVNDSLYESGLKLGVPSDILNTMIRTYSYNVDFQRDVKEGDRFEVLFEDGPTPTLIYSALEVGGKIMPIYRVAMPGGGFDYFDARGESIRKGLLRTPVEGAHLTSAFGMRMHPILGYSRMHKGVDFGAPWGSPIFAAGAGIVEEIGNKSGYGHYIRVRHNNTISTAYAHMSRYGRGITKGTRVAQGEIIGYVGSVGLSTGPHLHYEVLVDNEQVNPMGVNLAIGQSLTGRQLVAFQDWRNRVHTQFEQIMAANAASSQVASAQQASTKAR